MKRVLIIEDQILIAMAIQDELQFCGYGCAEIAVSGSAALRFARAHRPDLITFDLLADGSGLAAVQEICPDKSTPSIAITVDEFLVKAAIPHAEIIKKPFRAADLRRSSHRVIKKTCASFESCTQIDVTLEDSSEGCATDRGIGLNVALWWMAGAASEREEAFLIFLAKETLHAQVHNHRIWRPGRL